MEIEKEVTEFVKTINRGPLKEYFPKKKEDIDWDKDKIYVEALYQGYLDACRTFEWSEKVKKDYPNEKEKRGYIEGEFKLGIACKIREYLNNSKACSFDVFHGELCENLKECFREKETNITYGQAQKIINMAFKYLYCLYYKYGELKEEQFADCHMPLDSFSLEWFKRKFGEDDFTNFERYSENHKKLPENLFTQKGEKKKLKAESMGSWSSMQTWEEGCEKQEYPYEFYAYVIKKYCDERSITPLQLDFIVWSKIQKIMAEESFIKTFKDDDEENKEVINSEELEPYDILNLKTTLENRLSEIRPLICK